MSTKSLRLKFSRARMIILVLCMCISSGQAEPAMQVSASEQMKIIVKVLANDFSGRHDDMMVHVTSQNSGEAMTALREGRVEFAAVSRPPTREELRYFHQVDHKQLIGTPIAMGAVALIVRPDNPLSSMSAQQAKDVALRSIYDWTKLDVVVDGSVIHEHSSTCKHPIKKGALINLLVPMDGRDTLEYMRLGLRTPHHFPRDLPRLENDEQIAHQVSFDANAVGLVSWAPYDGVRFVAIKEDVKSKGVLPTQESIQSRAYPLSQYFYLYTSGELSATAKAFLAFAISQEGQQLITNAGGVPLPFFSTSN